MSIRLLFRKVLLETSFAPEHFLLIRVYIPAVPVDFNALCAFFRHKRCHMGLNDTVTPRQGSCVRVKMTLARSMAYGSNLGPETPFADPEQWSEVGEASGDNADSCLETGPHSDWGLRV